VPYFGHGGARNREDLSADQVLGFLEHMERNRKVTVGTRNCRLAALRSFFSHVATDTALGQRDHALISFLYNTATRIQETFDVCAPRAEGSLD
jgi:site-specific recombinase XerD